MLEYPKLLTRTRPGQSVDDVRIVAEAEQEAMARAEGFRFVADPPIVPEGPIAPSWPAREATDEPKKRGRTRHDAI